MKYAYAGPMQLLELPGGREVSLVGGRTYDLPADAPVVQRMVGMGRLAKAADKTDAVAPKKPKPKPSGGATRNLLADTIAVMKDGVRHPDVAAEAQAQASAPPASAPSKPAETAAPKEG